MDLSVPPPPEPEMITEEAADNVEKWISYFKELSPRIRVMTSFDTNFDLSKWEENAKILTRSHRHSDNISLLGWPTKEDVAFVVGIDSSVHTGVTNFLASNGFLFCRRDYAFGLDYFEEDDIQEDGFNKEYSLREYSKNALCWKHVAEVIKNRIVEIEKSIPKFDQK